MNGNGTGEGFRWQWILARRRNGRSETAFPRRQALLGAGWATFRRPGRFDLGVLDVLVAWRRRGVLRRFQPRRSLASAGGRPGHGLTTGERHGLTDGEQGVDLSRVDIEQGLMAPAGGVVTVHEQGAHTLDEVG